MDPELSQEMLRKLMISGATTDSIFSALGQPINPIKIASGGGGGTYNPSTNQITLSPESVILRVLFDQHLDGADPSTEATNLMGEILSHEMGHQATFNRADNPQFQGFLNLFLDKFRSLPLDAQLRHHEDYFGDLQPNLLRRQAAEQAQKTGANPYDVMGEMFDQMAANPEDRAMSEIIGNTVERGFALARRSGRSDIAELLDAQEEEFPGTREAFNFFIRSFQGMEPR